jgi:hypothetical protein
METVQNQSSDNVPNVNNIQLNVITEEWVRKKLNITHDNLGKTQISSLFFAFFLIIIIGNFNIDTR